MMTAFSQKMQKQIKILRTTTNVSDWDGEGASAVPSNLVDIAERALQLLDFDIEPNVTPSRDGEVSFVWAPWNDNQLVRLESLWISLDEDEFVYNVNSEPTQTVVWANAHDVDSCADMIVATIQTLLLLEE